MTDTNKKTAVTYPTPDQYAGWKADADEMDMSVSEWIQAMVEAGRKKFDATIEPDESAQELRQQRNDLKAELEHTRARVEELETQLHRSEREKIKQYVEDNPGATIGEIGQELADTIPERLDAHLDALEGVAVTVDDEACYPVEDT